MSIGFADLVKIAECDYKACEAMEQHFPDEFAVRTALYHLQQAVEKLLKAMIMYGGEYPAFTHDIEKLSEHCKKLGVTFSDNLDDISDSLTLWESKSRYDPYITFSKRKYEKAKDFYNEIHEKLMQEITPIVENAETEDVDFGENNNGMKMS
jgi:HEPN domain-containing protein